MDKVLSELSTELKRGREVSKMDTLTLLIGRQNPSAQAVAGKLKAELQRKFLITITDNYHGLSGGNVLIALSYPLRVPVEVLRDYDLAMVAHASDLPNGRGWSPANWAAERLETHIILSIIEMAEEIDAGRVFAKTRIDFPVWMLWPEFSALLENLQAETLKKLLTGNWRSLKGEPQSGTPTYFEKRTAANCELDPEKSLVEQWGKIRSSDPVRYPNYFILHGKRYQIRVDRLED